MRRRWQQRIQNFCHTTLHLKVFTLRTTLSLHIFSLHLVRTLRRLQVQLFVVFASYISSYIRFVDSVASGSSIVSPYEIRIFGRDSSQSSSAVLYIFPLEFFPHFFSSLLHVFHPFGSVGAALCDGGVTIQSSRR